MEKSIEENSLADKKNYRLGVLVATAMLRESGLVERAKTTIALAQSD